MIGKEPLKRVFVFGGLLVAFRGDMKTCSFFGHRDIPQTEELKGKVREIVERLILEEKYPHIRRIAYLCKHESGCLVGAGASLRRKIKVLTGRDAYVAEYEEIKRSDRINSAGRASYIERNQWIVDDGEFAIMHYENSKSMNRRGGTFLIYGYAQQKGKILINVYE